MGRRAVCRDCPCPLVSHRHPGPVSPTPRTRHPPRPPHPRRPSQTCSYAASKIACRFSSTLSAANVDPSASICQGFVAGVNYQIQVTTNRPPAPSLAPSHTCLGSLPHLALSLTWLPPSPGSLPHLALSLTWLSPSPGSPCAASDSVCFQHSATGQGTINTVTASIRVTDVPVAQVPIYPYLGLYPSLSSPYLCPWRRYDLPFPLSASLSPHRPLPFVRGA